MTARCASPDAGTSNDVDAAREFLRAVLDNRFDAAEGLSIQDSSNAEFLQTARRIYREQLTGEEKRQYASASINIHEVRPLNDSVSIIQYSNSYKKVRDSIRMVRQNGRWLADISYSFSVKK